MKLFFTFLKQGLKKFALNLNSLRYRRYFCISSREGLYKQSRTKFILNSTRFKRFQPFSILKDSRKLAFLFPLWILKNSFKTVRVKRVCKWLMKEGDLKLKFLFDRWSWDPVWSLRWEFVKKEWKRGCLFFMIDAFREMKGEASSGI